MISPQGYSYGKKPQSVNPFWDEDTEPVYFKEFTENKILTEVDSLCYFIQFYVNNIPGNTYSPEMLEKQGIKRFRIFP